MTSIFKKTSKGIKLVGESKPAAKLRVKKKVKSSKKKKTNKVDARRLKARKARKRRADSKRIDILKARTESVLNLRTCSAINPSNAVSEIKQALTKELSYLKKEMKGNLKKKDQTRNTKLTTLVFSLFKKIKVYEGILAQEKIVQQEIKEKGAANRKLTAKIIDKHPKGNVIGRVNVTEYKSPGSTLWATTRKTRK